MRRSATSRDAYFSFGLGLPFDDAKRTHTEIGHNVIGGTVRP